MSTTNISFSLESDLKEKAQKLFRELGLDMATALNIFIKQAVLQQGIPFEVNAENIQNNVSTLSGETSMPQKKSRAELRGWLKGKVWMADDFDAPLEDMKEYME